MTTRRIRRREFLVSTGAAATVALFGQSLLPGGIARAAGAVVRRDVGEMDASDPILVAYRAAIKAMRALPYTNPLSWAYQGAIHWTTLPGPPLTSWDNCEHGTEFFWSWHRMYLYWFERIIRRFCKDPCWALPYWNWAPGSELQLPAPFRDPASELYWPNRNPAMNSGAGSLVASTVSVASAFSLTNFMTANLNIQGPHGSVHVEVGGDMGSVPTAAQDPIFFVHHSNVDRLWDLWLAQGGGRTDPLADVPWKTKPYTFFDENGHPVKMTGCDVVRAAQQLHYVYEGEPPQVNEYCLRFVPPWVFEREVLMPVPIPPIELGPQPVSFPIELKELRQRLTTLAASETDTLFLELEQVEAEKQPGVVWEVYVGSPPNSAPDAKGPYFVGTLSLFGSGIRSETHHGFEPARFLYPVSRALQAALKGTEERFHVTFVPVGIVIDGKPSRPEVKSPVRIGKAALVVEHKRKSD
jgi:hypothetical protein